MIKEAPVAKYQSDEYQHHALTLAKERYDDMTAARRLTELCGTL
jgi:hypothetical protein